jgi:hypothetical protein
MMDRKGQRDREEGVQREGERRMEETPGGAERVSWIIEVTRHSPVITHNQPNDGPGFLFRVASKRQPTRPPLADDSADEPGPPEPFEYLED